MKPVADRMRSGDMAGDIIVDVPESESAVSLTRASDINPEPVDWLWPGWLARGKLHILAGAPGTGKTTIALSLAATITARGYWPDGVSAETGNVLIWSGEDGIGDTLVPRLISCGADRTRVHFVDGVDDWKGRRPFDPATDVPALRAAAGKIGNVALLIVDPVANAVSADSNKNAEVRRALQPLVDLGASLGCAVLGVTHFTKGTIGRDPVERVTGSLAFGALARIVLVTAKGSEDVDGGRLLARAKSNLGPDGGGFGYDIEQVGLTDFPGQFNSRVLWRGAVDGAARDLLAVAEQDNEDRTEREEVTEWLHGLLSEEGGQIDRRDVMRAAHAMGYKERTVHRARDALGLTMTQMGFGKDKRSTWRWGESSNRANISQSCQPFENGTYAKFGTNGEIALQGKHVRCLECRAWIDRRCAEGMTVSEPGFPRLCGMYSMRPTLQEAGDAV